MKKLLYLFLFLSTLYVDAQVLINPYAHTLGGGQGGGLTYVAIPTAPTFTTPNELVEATVGTTITAGELGGQADQLVDGDADFTLMSFSGTNNIRVKSEDDTDPSTWSISGVGGGLNESIKSENNSTGVEFYNLRTANRSRGFGWDVDVSAPTLKVQNTIHENHTGAGYQINRTGAGDTYGLLDLSFVRILNVGTSGDGEGLYLGSTVAGSDGVFSQSNIQHIYIDTTGWDGFQCNGHLKLTASNVTGLNLGTGVPTDVGQTACLQLQDVRGTFSKSLLSGTYAFRISAHSLLIQDVYVKWTADDTSPHNDMVDGGYIKTITPTTTSTTSNDIPTTHPTQLTFTVAASGLDYNVDQLLLIDNGNTNYFWGTVESYTSTTLVINSMGHVGSGTFASWDVGGLVLYDNITFDNASLTAAYVVAVAEDETHIIFQDCIIPSAASSCFLDNRTDKTTFILTEINTTVDGTPNVPTFGDPPEAAYVGYEKVVTDSFYYNQGMGYRTPAP